MRGVVRDVMSPTITPSCRTSKRMRREVVEMRRWKGLVGWCAREEIMEEGGRWGCG